MKSEPGHGARAWGIHSVSKPDSPEIRCRVVAVVAVHGTGDDENWGTHNFNRVTERRELPRRPVDSSETAMT
jgi:hypothetical protein